MQIETTHGSVTFSRSSGEQQLRVFSARWSMPVVALAPGADGDAAYGVVFQVGSEEAWCFLHLMPPDRGGEVEVLLTLLEKAMSEALCKLAEWRPPGALLPCACLLDNGDGTMSAGMAVFTSDALLADAGPGARSELAEAFVDVLSTTASGSLLPPFQPARRVPRLSAGAIKFDTALVDGAPLCFRVQPHDPTDEEEQRELAAIWARGRVKHIAWAPAIPIFLSEEEAAAIGAAPSQPQQQTQPEPEATATRNALAQDASAVAVPTPKNVDPRKTPASQKAELPSFSEVSVAPEAAPKNDRPVDDSLAVHFAPSSDSPAARKPSTMTPAMSPVAQPEADARRRRRGDSSIWGPTVMDFNAQLTESSDREALVRLRGATIGSGDEDANAAALAAVARADGIAEVDGGPGFGPRLRMATDPTTQLPIPSESAGGAVDDAVIAVKPKNDDFNSTNVSSMAKAATTVGAPADAYTAASWDAPTVNAIAGADAARHPSRFTAEYTQAHQEPSLEDEKDTAETPTVTPGIGGLERLSATSWAALHEFAGDRAHAALVATALRTLKVAQRWPDSLPEADEILRENGDIVLRRQGAPIGVLSVRIGRDLDPIAMSAARELAPDGYAWVVTLEKLEPAAIPGGWRSKSIDEVENWSRSVAHDPVARAHADALAQLAATRDSFVHDALADATDWSDSLAGSAFGSALRQVLHRDVMSTVLAGLYGHGWDRLNHEQVYAGQVPGVRVFDANVRGFGNVPCSEVALIDPASPHVYGVRAIGGRVLIFAEAFDAARTGVQATLAWGRRNEFLRDLCGLLQIDTKFIEGQATDSSRWVEIDSYDLLRADQRKALSQTMIETSWVVWQKTHEGRFARR